VSPRPDSKLIMFSNGRIRCVVVHDYVLLRQGLRRLLEDEPDIDVVSEAGNAAECLRNVHELRPDVVVADAGTFDLPTQEAESLVARESPHTKIVFVSMLEQTGLRFSGLRVATAECAVRETSAEALVGMVRSLYGGNRANNREAFVGSDRPRHSTTNSPQESPLTAREREVLKLLAEGKTVRASASVLGLSVKTVDAHKFNLMRKLGVHNKAELVMSAIQMKVVKIPVNF
jgi:two-component system response regulator NreC